MAPPNPPYVDIRSGANIGPGFPVPVGETFYWYNSNQPGGPNCSVTAQNNWCTVPSAPLAPGASFQATVGSGLGTGMYNWSSPCCQNAMPVHVSGSHPKPPKKK